MIINLSSRKILRLTRARGSSIEALDGAVWVTEAGVDADACIARGAQYRVRGDGLVLVGSEVDRDRHGATVAVRPAPGQPQDAFLRHLGFKRLSQWNI